MRKSTQKKCRYLRFAIMGMVQLQQSPKGKRQEAYLANISRDGIGLYIHKRISPGKTYYIRPMSWNNLDELWTARAVWCKPEGDCMMAGLKLISITHQDFGR
jgi:hypothetical protein